ncbi:MAG: hypothetical protein AAF367_04220 [Pseudomonadota bacterium]
MRRISALSIGICAALAGCGETNAIFVTSTSIGINAETTPPNISLAYDRQEGFYGPTDESGSAPPVVARITSNQSIINPEVVQLYATGEAALDVTVGEGAVAARRNAIAQDATISGDRRVAFFGTAQTTGLKVTFNPVNVVDSVTLGYKRKEASYLPLVEDEAGIARYPSTLAALTLNSRIQGLSDTNLGMGQFFATGDAARNLAVSPGIRGLFGEMARQSVEAAAATSVARDQQSDCISAWVRQPENRAAARAWLDANGIDLFTLNNVAPQADRDRFIAMNGVTCE